MNSQLNEVLARQRILELTRAAEQSRLARSARQRDHEHWRLVAVVRLVLRRPEARSAAPEPRRVAWVSAQGLTARRDG
jgi:hypothetical protein